MKRKGAPPARQMPPPPQRPRSSDAAAWPPSAEAPQDPDPREAAALAATVAIYKNTRVTKKLSPLQAGARKLTRLTAIRWSAYATARIFRATTDTRPSKSSSSACRSCGAPPWRSESRSESHSRNAPPPNRRGPRRHLGRPHLPLGDASRGSEETWPSAPCGARLTIGGIHQRKYRASYGKLWVLEEVRNDVENTLGAIERHQ